MNRRRCVAAAIALAGCGGGDSTPPADACDFVGSAAPGSASISVENTFPRTVTARSGSWEVTTSAAGSTVLDAFTAGSDGVPTFELFIFHRNRPFPDTVPLVPVSLAEMKSDTYQPSGSFVALGDAWSEAAGDYTRWFVSAVGCLALDQVVADDRILARVRASGQWVTPEGTPLGNAVLVATVNAPFVSFRTATAAFRDTMHAAADGIGLGMATLDAFQVLRPGQVRTLIVGTAALDTTREVWLSLPGLPEIGDSVGLDSVSVDDALAGRAAGPFAMVRHVVPAIGGGTITEIWTSTDGWVTVDDLVLTGPLAVCSAAWGRFEFIARGTRLESGGSRTDLGTRTVGDGSFRTRLTVLAPSDTVTDPNEPPSAAMGLAAPVAGAPRCP